MHGAGGAARWALVEGRARPLYRWFERYAVLLAAFVLVLGFLTGGLGGALGIPDLFWDEHLVHQLFAGLGVGFLAADLGQIGFLLERHEPWLNDLGGPELFGLQPRSDRALVRYLFRTSGVLWVAVAASAWTAPEGVPVAPLVAGSLVGVALLPGLLLLVKRGSLVRDLAVRAMPVGILPREALEQPELDALAFLYAVAKLVLYLLLWGASSLGVALSVGFVICLLLGLGSSVYGYLKYRFRGRSAPVVAVGVAVLLVVNAPVGHRFADLDYAAPFPLSRYDPSSTGGGLLESREVLPAWARRQGRDRPGEETPGARPPLVVVAVDGGGLRAALWTVSVLTRLEQDVPRLPYGTRLVTGASGGMVGAAFYVASLSPPAGAPGALHSDRTVPLDREEMVRRIGTESLEAVARTLVFGDFMPPLLHPADDRGYALERRWEESTRVLQAPLASLRPREREGWCPSLVFAPLLVEDGRRLFVTNLDLADLATLRLPTGPETTGTLQALEFFKLFPGETDLRLSAAARMSAAFPYVTPAAEIPTEPSYRVVDAGYYDAHGVELAASWIHLHRGWLRENTGGVALVQIRDQPTLESRQEAGGRHRSLWARGLSALSSPVEALFAGRSASMAFRDDSLVRMLSHDLDVDGSPGFFETFVFEPAPPRDGEGETGEDVALSWRLTSREQRWLEAGPDAAPNVERRRELASWWKAHGGS